MGLLDRLVRSPRTLYRAPRYLTQSRYTGTFPVGSARRVSLLTPNGSLLALRLLSNPVPLPAPKSKLSVYEDRRLWHPEGAAARPRSKTEWFPTVVDRSPVEIDPDIWRKISTPPRTIPWKKLARQSLINAPVSVGFGWEQPYKMIICLKRKARREVMHALHLAGKTGFKKPRYTQYSYVRCF